METFFTSTNPEADTVTLIWSPAATLEISSADKERVTPAFSPAKTAPPNASNIPAANGKILRTLFRIIHSPL
jgi:hypothetical protein